MSDRDGRGGFRRYVRQLEAAVETNPDAVVVKDCDGRYQFANEAAADFLGREVGDLLGRTDADLFGEASARDLRERERQVLAAETGLTFEETLPMADGERVFETTCSPYYGPDGDLAGTVSVCRDVTDRKARERALADRRDELATLDRINEVVQEVVRTLVGEPTREEIEQAVCDRLVETELYRVAWVGEPDPAGPEMTDVVGAGLDEETRDLIASIDASEDSDEPVPRAYYTGETQIVQNVPDDESLSERRREEVLDHGDRSGIAVPIRSGDVTRGVLVVGSERLSAFSDREAAAFDVLGEVIGFAIGAVEHRRLALSDEVVELEFRLTDADSFHVTVSEQLDCRVRLEGIAAGPEGCLLFYDAVSGADPESVLEFTADWEAVEDARLVDDHDEAALFEFAVSGPSVVSTLSERGAKPDEVVSEDGETHVVAQLPRDADVRSVVEHVRAAFPDAELVAKRERSHDLRTTREFRQDLDQRLTDAQRTALRASYFAGYYEWPRNSTAEEIADALGVASPTFHQHIRKAQRQLLRTFFDRDRDPP